MAHSFFVFFPPWIMHYYYYSWKIWSYICKPLVKVLRHTSFYWKIFPQEIPNIWTWRGRDGMNAVNVNSCRRYQSSAGHWCCLTSVHHRPRPSTKRNAALSGEGREGKRGTMEQLKGGRMEDEMEAFNTMTLYAQNWGAKLIWFLFK